MTARNTAHVWGWVAKAFHWLMFLLIVGAWFAVTQHEAYPKGSDERAAFMLVHKSIGLTVFFLIWWRLGWRLFGGALPTPDPAPQWQLKSATLLHWALYALMILMPLSGILMSQFGGRPVPWFGLFEIPAFLPENKALAGNIKNMHEHVWWPLLLGLSVAHVAAALWHHIVMKDKTLKRMLPFGKSE